MCVCVSFIQGVLNQFICLILQILKLKRQPLLLNSSRLWRQSSITCHRRDRGKFHGIFIYYYFYQFCNYSDQDFPFQASIFVVNFKFCCSVPLENLLRGSTNKMFKYSSVNQTLLFCEKSYNVYESRCKIQFRFISYIFIVSNRAHGDNYYVFLIWIAYWIWFMEVASLGTFLLVL